MDFKQLEAFGRRGKSGQLFQGGGQAVFNAADHQRAYPRAGTGAWRAVDCAHHQGGLSVQGGQTGFTPMRKTSCVCGTTRSLP